MKQHLTDARVEAIPVGGIVHDDTVGGFGCRVSSGGKRTYFLFYRTRRGRQRRPTIGVHGSITCAQARAIAAGWLVEVAAGGDPSGDMKQARAELTLRDFADVYLADHADAYKKARSAAGDRHQINKHLLPALGARKLSAITSQDVGRLHASLKDRPYAANRALALLSVMFNLAEQWGYFPGPNPCRHVKRYREEARKRYATLDEIRRLMRAMRPTNGSLAAINALRLILLTGCRSGEIKSLRWEDVDLEGQRLNLADSKTGAKTVYLNAPALDLLRVIKRGPSGYVCPGARPDTPITELKRAWRNVCAAANVKGLRIHDLRHSYATIGVSLNLGLPVIGALLGHSQARTTERYAHAADDPLRAASDAIGDVLAAAMKGIAQ